VCDEAQRQVIREWAAKLGVEPRELHVGPA
jgi:hypothetical protein